MLIMLSNFLKSEINKQIKHEEPSFCKESNALIAENSIENFRWKAVIKKGRNNMLSGETLLLKNNEIIVNQKITNYHTETSIHNFFTEVKKQLQIKIISL